jgi:hypothetical protein
MASVCNQAAVIIGRLVSTVIKCAAVGCACGVLGLAIGTHTSLRRVLRSLGGDLCGLRRVLCSLRCVAPAGGETGSGHRCAGRDLGRSRWNDNSADDVDDAYSVLQLLSGCAVRDSGRCRRNDGFGRLRCGRCCRRHRAEDRGPGNETDGSAAEDGETRTNNQCVLQTLGRIPDVIVTPRVLWAPRENLKSRSRRRFLLIRQWLRCEGTMASS